MLNKLCVFTEKNYRTYLQRLMKANGFSYRTLADALGVSKGVLHGLCGGRYKRNMNRDLLIRFKRLFKLTKDESIYLALLAEIDGGILTFRDRNRVLNLVRGRSNECLKNLNR